MKILSGHVSMETAYVVDDYPYGFRLRCKIRYWLEHNPKLGTRLWSQTTNPKSPTHKAPPGSDHMYLTISEVWNKPRASTYCKFGGAMYLDNEDHVQWSGLSMYNDTKKAQEWLDKFREGLPPEVIEKAELWIEEKMAYETGGWDALIELRAKMAGVKLNKEDEEVRSNE